MKQLLLLILAFIFLNPVFSFSNDEDDYQRQLIKEQQKKFKGREALRREREEKKKLNTDFSKIDAINAEIRRQQKERLEQLQNNFTEIVFFELEQARRLYDHATVAILEDEALKRYEKDPTPFYTKARLYILLFNTEHLLYRYHATKLMYERPRIRNERQNQAELGLALVEKMLEKDAADPELWRLKAIFLSCFKDRKFSKSKYSKQAEETFKYAISLSPQPAKAKLSLASFYMNQPEKEGKDIEEAKLLAEELVKENPKNVDALLILGRYYQEKYDYGNAYMVFKKTLELEPKNPEVNYYYAIAHTDKKRYKKLMRF